MNSRRYQIPCYLTDRYGKILDVCNPNALIYREDRISEQYEIYGMSAAGKVMIKQIFNLIMDGFVGYYECGEKMLQPIPFHIVTRISICKELGSTTQYKLHNFHGIAIITNDGYGNEQVEIQLRVGTTVIAAQEYEVVSTVKYRCKQQLLKTQIYQYNAIGNGERRVFTNADEIAEYGQQGILSPWDVSYYDVFVNGMLLPQSDYVITKGKLQFNTIDVPSNGQIINVIFVTIKSESGYILRGELSHYSAKANGTKNCYTDEDELIEYGRSGIPDVSYCSLISLYVNGCIQPKANYSIDEQRLCFATDEIPSDGTILILESIRLYGLAGQLLRMRESQFVTKSNGTYVLQSTDKMEDYESDSIPNPNCYSFQHLYTNGIIQPKDHYLERKDVIRFRTDSPVVEGAAITLQSIAIKVMNPILSEVMWAVRERR